MAEPLHLTTVSVQTRQIAVGDLSALAQAFFQFAFPGFFTPPSERAPDDPDHPDFDGKVHHNLKARRYCGDILSFHGARESDLPRGCYHALAGSDGTDLGLLRNELRAYANYDETGPFLLIDAALESEYAMVGLPAPEPSIIGLLPAGTRAHLRFRQHLQAAGLSDDHAQQLLMPGFDRHISVRMNTDTLQLDIGEAVDLRCPKAREAFHRRYARGIDGLPGFGAPAPGPGFEHLLPTLLGKQRGGPLTTQMIGMDLRRNGVGALIYPSARIDAHVTVEDGQVSDWRGFNLVDYRNAPAVLTPENGDFVLTDLETLGRGGQDGLAGKTRVFIHIDPFWNGPGARPIPGLSVGEGEYAGSFEIDGVEAELDAELTARFEAEKQPVPEEGAAGAPVPAEPSPAEGATPEPDPLPGPDAHSQAGPERAQRSRRIGWLLALASLLAAGLAAWRFLSP